MTMDRRRSPRIQMAPDVAGRSTTAGAPIRVRDFSLGGMAIETSVDLPLGSVHEFDVTLGDGSVVGLRGRILRSRNLAGGGEPPLYALGVQFVDDDTTEEIARGRLIDRLQS
jgi:hypothetical protein